MVLKSLEFFFFFDHSAREAFFLQTTSSSSALSLVPSIAKVALVTNVDSHRPQRIFRARTYLAPSGSPSSSSSFSASAPAAAAAPASAAAAPAAAAADDDLFPMLSGPLQDQISTSMAIETVDINGFFFETNENSSRSMTQSRENQTHNTH